MLCKIIEAVILLSFLLAIVLEVSVLLVMLQSEAIEEPKTAPKPRKIRLKRAERKAKTEQEKKFETLLNNIDAYDGTTFGQKDLE